MKYLGKYWPVCQTKCSSAVKLPNLLSANCTIPTVLTHQFRTLKGYVICDSHYCIVNHYGRQFSVCLTNRKLTEYTLVSLYRSSYTQDNS